MTRKSGQTNVNPNYVIRGGFYLPFVSIWCGLQRGLFTMTGLIILSLKLTVQLNLGAYGKYIVDISHQTALN